MNFKCNLIFYCILSNNNKNKCKWQILWIFFFLWSQKNRRYLKNGIDIKIGENKDKKLKMEKKLKLFIKN